MPLNPNRRDRSAGSDDQARRDYLKLDAPIKQGGPVDGQVELLSDRQRSVGSEAQTGAAHVDSAAGAGFKRLTAREAIPTSRFTGTRTLLRRSGLSPCSNHNRRMI